MSDRNVDRITANLIKARDLIADQKRWCQGSFRRKNKITGEYKYCAIGALRMAFYGRPHGTPCTSDYENAIRLLTQSAGNLCVVHFNDTRSHEQVLECLDRAIAKSMEKQNV